MRVRSVLILSALLAATTVAAAEPQHESPRDKALMLYFSKSFGATQRQARTPLQFGLRLQQSSPFDNGRALALVDARFQLGGPRVLAFAGVPALSLGNTGDEDEGSSSDMSGAIRGFGSRHPGWTIAMIVGSVLAGACLAEWGICEEDEPEESEGEPTYPTTGPR